MRTLRARALILTLALAAALALVSGAAARSSQPSQVRAVFFANWDRYARGYFVNQIPAARLNVIDYAFAMPTAAGTRALSDSWSDDQAARRVAGAVGRRRGRGRALRRDRHRLGVPGHRPRQRGGSLTGRQAQRDALAPGVPQPARRVRRDDGEALPPDGRPSGRKRELVGELGALGRGAG